MSDEQAIQSIGILGFGAMGSGVAATLKRAGFEVGTCLTGRSDRSRARAEQAGVACHESIEDLIHAVDLFISLVPADQAEPLAHSVAAAMVGRDPAGGPLRFLDANSITPSRTRRISEHMRAAGAIFYDGGVIGPPPKAGKAWTRTYVAGPGSAELTALQTPEMTVTRLGDGDTQATEMKVLFAAINKGTVALLANVFAAADKVDLIGPLSNELRGVQPALLDMLQGQAPDLEEKAARWAVEMDDLADGLDELGCERGFHDAAGRAYRRLDRQLGEGIGRDAGDEFGRVLAAWRRQD